MFAARIGSGCFLLVARTGCLLPIAGSAPVWIFGGLLGPVLTRTAAYCCSSGLPELLGWQNCAAALGSTVLPFQVTY